MRTEREVPAPRATKDTVLTVEGLRRNSLLSQGFNDKVVDIMLKARRDKSYKLYDCYLNKWLVYCDKVQCDPIYATVKTVLDFLQELFNEGCRGSSAMGTARSAISSVVILADGSTVGQNRYVSQFMKGVSAIKPAQPRYLETWDPDVLIEMFKSDKWNPCGDLDLMSLTVKLAVLILLATYNRGQLILALKISRMFRVSDDEVRFKILPSELKQGCKKNYKPEPVVFKRLTENPEVCILSHIDVYLSKTSEVRKGCDQVFMTTKKPHRAVSRDSVSHWIKAAMRHAKINVEVFAPGSIRGASSSGAFLAGVPLDQILRKAGWSKESTFLKWYKRV